jgi:hypothetical protein
MWAHVIHLSARSLSPTRGSLLWDYFDHDNAIFVDGKYRALQFKVAQVVVRLALNLHVASWRNAVGALSHLKCFVRLIGQQPYICKTNNSTPASVERIQVFAFAGPD